jgi:hypothetical protein
MVVPLLLGRKNAHCYRVEDQGFCVVLVLLAVLFCDAGVFKGVNEVRLALPQCDAKARGLRPVLATRVCLQIG